MSDHLAAEVRDAPELRAWAVDQMLGRGGMGSVYRATHRVSGEKRAIKIMELVGHADDEADRLVRREIDHCLALHHPCVIESFEGGGAGQGHYFLVMELCEGGSVDRLVAAGGPVRVPYALALTLDLLDGLDYAHHFEVPQGSRGAESVAVGLVHRDVKPANVMVAAAGRRAKVADFGLAKAFETAGLSGLTRTGMAGGTPAFMPRQQVLDYKYATPEVDVWAAAATLYYLLTAEPPRDFKRGADPWRVVWDTDPVPVQGRRGEVPAHLASVVDAALDDRQGLRFDTARGLAEALRNACAKDGVASL